MLNLGNLTPWGLANWIAIPWSSYASDGHSVNPTTAGTITIYRVDLSGTLTAVGGTLNVSDTRSVGGRAGMHLYQFKVDPNANPTGGLILGADHVVMLEGAVIDGKTVSAVLATFGFLTPTRDSQITVASQVVTTGTGGTGPVTMPIKPGDYVWLLPYYTAVGTLVASELRMIETYTPGTGAFTVRGGWSSTPPATAYAVFLHGAVVDQIQEADFATDAISARVLAADAATEIATAVGAFSIPDGSLTEAKFGTDALSARVLKADAVAEMQAGLATAAGLTPLATAAAQTALAAAVAAVQADTDNLQTRLPAALVGGKMDAVATVTGLDSPTLAAIADQVWDYVNKIEPGISPKAALRVLLAVFAGLTTGVTGSAPVFKSADVTGGVVQGTKSRVIGVQNANDERTSVTLDTSDV